MGEWQETPLSTVASLRLKTVDPSLLGDQLVEHYSIPAYDSGSAEIVPASQIQSNKFAVPDDAVLVSRMNPHIPRVWHIKSRGSHPRLCSTEFVPLLPRQPYASYFLYQLCRSPKFLGSVAELTTGTTGSHQRVERSALLCIPVPLPPLSEQRAIAEVLGALDDKIEANRRVAERVEHLAIDVSATMIATRTVGSVAEVHRDLVSTAAFASQVVEHFSLPAFDSSRLPCVENGDVIKSGKFLLDGPTVLVSKLNPRIPRVWMAVPTGGCSAVTSTEFVGLVPTTDYPVEVLWVLCASAKFSSQLAEMARGTTGSHQRVSVDDVLSLKVPDPEMLGKDIMEIIAAAVGLAGTLRKESLHLASLRDALLPKLLSGELRVRDAESLVEEAV